jgi:hypothetical protein
MEKAGTMLFSIYSTMLRACPELAEGTGLRFSILDWSFFYDLYGSKKTVFIGVNPPVRDALGGVKKKTF